MKKFLIGLITYILINLVFIYGISFSIKGLVLDTVLKESIIEKIFSDKFNVNNYNNNNSGGESTEINNIVGNKELIEKILNDKDTKELINKYVDTTIESISSDKEVDINIEEDIITYIKENKDIVEEVTGEKITDEQIDELSKELNDKSLSNAYKEKINETKSSFSGEQMNVLKSFGFVLSRNFRIILIILIIVNLLLIALIKWSLYKWISNFSYSFGFGGLFLSFVGLIFGYFINTVFKVNISYFNPMVNCGIVFIVIGIVSFIIYIVLNKILSKDDVDVIS